ncbi:MFS transporter [Comamonas testosteroni]|uniref:MFS transporter n=1 Tax=Comamonas testosteroni TaxID=285 RepID=UPI00389AD52B
MTNRVSANAAGSTLIFVGLILVATTLRAPITGVGPVLNQIQNTFALSPAMAGFLTSLPLLAFGFISPFAGGFARRVGFEQSLRYSLVAVIVGIALRSAGHEWALFLGTALLGVGISFGNVLMPALVKREYPEKVPAVTGRCGIAMGLAAALSSASAYPISTIAGWQGALVAPILFPALALVAWLAFKPKNVPSASLAAGVVPVVVSPWSSSLAWQVTGFMAINSVLFYALITWLPSILTASGQSAATAGSIHGFLQTASIVPGLLLGGLVSRMRDQKAVALGLTVVQIVALLGLANLPAWAPLWAFLFGMGSGGALLLSLMFFGMRTRSPQQAAALSGMAQCVNFLAAAPGPVLAGTLQKSFGSWTPVLYLGVGLAIVMAILGLMAGRRRILED